MRTPFLKKKPKRSVVYIDTDGNYLWEEGVEYNDGVLVAPVPMTVEEWEKRNIEDDKKKLNSEESSSTCI